MGWLIAQQAAFYRMLVQAVSSAKTDGAAFGLLAVSFFYGIFHAAGPGHGKAVISSYLLADGSTYRRGLALTAAASALQALTAIALVGIAAIALGATAQVMNTTVRVIELGSYALIVVFGLYLTWQKGRALVAAWRGQEPHHHHDHAHGHHHHRPSWPRPFARPGAGGAEGQGLVPPWLDGGGGGGRAALLGRDPGAGVRAVAGHFLDRGARDLRHGLRHRDHGGRRGLARAPGAPGWPGVSQGGPAARA